MGTWLKDTQNTTEDGFGSGIVMMYAGGMPPLAPETRLERPPAIRRRVKLTPAEAAERAGAGGGGRAAADGHGPARLSHSARARRTVFADTGEMLGDVSVEQAQRRSPGRFDGCPSRRAHVETLSETDQWTLGQGRAAAAAQVPRRR